MLVLSRKKGQSIIINDDIEIFVLSHEGDQVKLGIKAPSEVKIYRQEILEAIRESNREAIASPQSLELLKGMSNQSLIELIKPES
jgi:carbon storage regulator